MRNLIYAINMTIDGCCDHTKGKGDEEIHGYFTRLLREVDLLIYGRITYQLMVPFWPDIAKKQSGHTAAMNEFAQAFDSLNRVVFSRTLGEAEDEKTKIIRTGLKDEILKLKQEPGRDILLGGVDLPSQVIALGLVDEYRIVVQPVLAGEGRRLMEDVPLQESMPLRLVESTVLKSGSVALRYLKQ